MSIESAKAFLEKLDNDPRLRSELFAGNENADRISVSADRLAELAARHDFAVTPKEIRTACAEQGRLPGGELADAELEAVAGGVSTTDISFTKYTDKSSPKLF